MMDGPICHICMTPLAYHAKGHNCAMEAQASQTTTPPSAGPAEVRRYNFLVGGGRFFHSKDEKFVLASDYATLAARCASQARELAELRERVAQLSAHHRWNIDELDGGRLAICRGDHERPFKCDYETYVPAQLLTAAEQSLAAMRAVVEAHCVDLERCVPTLVAWRLSSTAAEFRLAVTELRAACKVQP
jgi:hypothetical protein